MDHLLSLILCFVLQGCTGTSEVVQKRDSLNQGTVVYKILKQELTINSIQPEVDLPFILINHSSKRLLLYSFRGLKDGIRADSLYMNMENVVGNVILIYRNNKQVFPWFDISPDLEYDYTEMTPEKLNNIHDAEKQKIMNSMLILDPTDSIKLSTKINLKEFELEKGVYQLCLLYYSGKNLKTYISVEERKAIENKNEAVILKGWVKSNTVKLIVE